MRGERPMRASLALLAAVSICFLAAMSSCEGEELSIASVAPGSGIVGGNEPVKIQGTGFRQGMGIDVYFGNAKSPAVVVEGQTLIVATTPPGAKAGLVDIRIQTDQGNNIILRNAFRYVESQDWNLTDGFGGTRSKSGQ